MKTKLTTPGQYNLSVAVVNGNSDRQTSLLKYIPIRLDHLPQIISVIPVAKMHLLVSTCLSSHPAAVTKCTHYSHNYVNRQHI